MVDDLFDDFGWQQIGMAGALAEEMAEEEKERLRRKREMEQEDCECDCEDPPDDDPCP